MLDSRRQRVQPLAHPVNDLGNRHLTAHVVNHTVGSVAYMVANAKSGFLFSGDMSSTPELWTALRAEKKLSKVIVDCSFTNADMELAGAPYRYS